MFFFFCEIYTRYIYIYLEGGWGIRLLKREEGASESVWCNSTVAFVEGSTEVELFFLFAGPTEGNLLESSHGRGAAELSKNFPRIF